MSVKYGFITVADEIFDICGINACPMPAGKTATVTGSQETSVYSPTVFCLFGNI